MSLTIEVNNLSLCHKGSNGISTATVPDVCKTPSPGGPVPLPYPNISMSSDLENGTTTVEADGGNMIAIKGSDFSRSTGDEPGTVGGVKSNVNMKESKWILYSFDVKFEDANVCRLTDKKTQNHENTVDATGLVQVLIPATVLEAELSGIARDCHNQVEAAQPTPKESCTVRGTRKHKCCRERVRALNRPNVIADEPPDPIKAPGCIPDVSVVSPSGSVLRVYDFKFNCRGKPKMSNKQATKYYKAFKRVIKLIGP